MNKHYNVGDCCAIVCVSGFPIDGFFKNISKQLITKKKKSIKKYLQDYATSSEEEGKSVLFATVNTNQLVMEELLIEEGFVATTPNFIYRNPTHSAHTTGIKIYTKLLYPIDHEGKCYHSVGES